MTGSWPCGHEKGPGTTRCWVEGCDTSPAYTSHERGVRALSKLGPGLLTSTSAVLVLLGLLAGGIGLGFAVLLGIGSIVAVYLLGRTD